jgi:hypothetical protein
MKPAEAVPVIGAQAFFQHQSEFPMKYGMNRRWFVAGAMAAVVAASTLGPARAASEDPVALVRSVYTRAAALGANALPERDFLALLSADLRKTWQARGQLATDGRRLRTAVFGPGAGASHEVAVKSVTNIPGLPKERIVAVEFTAGTDVRQVFVHLAPAADGWSIVNIIYDEGDDLRHNAEQVAQTSG